MDMEDFPPPPPDRKQLCPLTALSTHTLYLIWLAYKCVNVDIGSSYVTNETISF